MRLQKSNITSSIVYINGKSQNMYLFLIHLPLISLRRSFSKPFLTLLNVESYLDFYTIPRFSEIRPYTFLMSRGSLLHQPPPELATKIISWRHFIDFSLEFYAPFPWDLEVAKKRKNYNCKVYPSWMDECGCMNPHNCLFLIITQRASLIFIFLPNI